MGLSHIIIRSRHFFHRNPTLSFINQQSFSSSNSLKPTSLSARMSFVFDQIDTIEKDETLKRIRAWRESKKEKQPTIEHSPRNNDDDDVIVAEKGLLTKAVELVHPWPEWIELMERLVQQNYFDCRRKDEDKLISDSGFGVMTDVIEEGFDFTRDWKTVQTAFLSFGKDRFDILRSLSRHDIQLLVGYGCANPDKKVVFSSKLLRKHVHLDEGDVCSSCSLRNSCERAYLVTNKEDEARTIDIMRVLMAYGFNESVVNESLLKKKAVKGAVRKLLHQVVKLSGIPIDPNLAPPIIKKPPPKVKQTPPPPKRRVGRDDVEMKKGDWLCPKCDFMNFAKNTVCLQCDAKRPKRQLLPGEWECPECKFLNYRRNMACFHCECKRPPDEFTESQTRDSQRSRFDQVPSRKEVSDAWNFDFDENESDGAEVAAFEYADSRKLDQYRMGDEDMIRSEKVNNFNTRQLQESKYSVGFDDFDDEEDDDVNNYELDTKPSNSSVNFSDLDVDSGSEDDNNHNYNNNNNNRSRQQRVSKSFKKPASVDFNSDDDLPIHPKWKSSHVADSKHSKMRTKFGSDEDSDFDDFPHKHKKRGSNDYRKVKREFSDEEDRFTSRRKNTSKQFAKSFRSEGGLRNQKQENTTRRSNRASSGSVSDSYLDHERFSRPRVNVR